MEPVVKAPVIEHLKLKYDEPLIKVAFKFNLRRYPVGWQEIVVDGQAKVFKDVIEPLESVAGGSLRTSTRRTLNLLLLRESV